MSQETQLEVYRQHRESQNQYIYFLLAAAGAAIAFAVNQTQNAALAWSMIPLGIAVLCWGGSFFCGCRQLACITSSLYSNHQLLRIQSGMHPDVGNHPQMIEVASGEISSAIDRKSKSSVWYAKAQFSLLIAGAVFFIVWHVIAMAQRVAK